MGQAGLQETAERQLFQTGCYSNTHMLHVTCAISLNLCSVMLSSAVLSVLLAAVVASSLAQQSHTTTRTYTTNWLARFHLSSQYLALTSSKAAGGERARAASSLLGPLWAVTSQWNTLTPSTSLQ